MFNLQFISEPTWSVERNELIVRGRITLRDFSEEFESSLSYWSQAEYERQWFEAAKRFEAGRTKSAFIVDMYDPGEAAFIVWWPLWKQEKTLFVQNQLLFLKTLDEAFDPTNPHVHIGERATETEGGEAISEWQVDITDVQDFISSRTATSV